MTRSGASEQSSTAGTVGGAGLELGNTGEKQARAAGRSRVRAPPLPCFRHSDTLRRPSALCTGLCTGSCRAGLPAEFESPRILDTGYWILDTGCWMLDTEYSISIYLLCLSPWTPGRPRSRICQEDVLGAPAPALCAWKGSLSLSLSLRLLGLVCFHPIHPEV